MANTSVCEWKGDHLSFSIKQKRTQAKKLFLSEVCILLYQISMCCFLELRGLGKAWFPFPWFSYGCGGECGQTRLVCLLVTLPPSSRLCRQVKTVFKSSCKISGLWSGDQKFLKGRGLYLRTHGSWFSSVPVLETHLKAVEKHILGCSKFHKNGSRICF